jgi:hypothetical protein
VAEVAARLERVAEAVADGVSVDWGAVEARCGSDREARVAANLRLLDRLASGAGSASGRGSRAGPATPALLLRLERAIGLGQVLTGWAGYVVGRHDGRPIPAELLLAVSLACGVGALALLRSERRDPRAGHLGTLFLLLAAACSHRTAGWLGAALPLWAPGLGALHALAVEAFVPARLWSFVRAFPRLVALRPLDAGLARGQRLASAAGVVWALVHLAAWMHHPADPADGALGVLTRWHAGGLFWGLLLAAAAPALALALRRAREAAPGERRRVTFFVVALAVGLAPLTVLVVLEAFVPAFARFMQPSERERLGAALVFGGVLTLPLTCAYAVVAHRVLDVRLAARALVRRLVVVGAGLTLPAAAAAFGLRRLYALRGESLAGIAGGAHAPVLAVTFAAALLLWRWRERPRAVARRVLGSDRPDWRRAVADFGRALADARDASEVLALWARSAREALRVEQAQALVRGRRSFEPLAPGWRALPVESALAGLLDAAGPPLVTDPDEPGSVFPWLPEGERQWLADGDVRLLVPLTTADSGTVALLALSARRDGLPLDRDDLLLMDALAGPAALRVEAAGGAPAAAAERAPVERPAGECDVCCRITDSGQGSCACGAPLRPAAIPRLLAGKFRVEALLGRGGMGVVYRARDLSLDRDVALKTLPRLSAEAALRLRGEARAMAAFVHPHLAAIHGAESWRGVPVLVVEFLAGGTLAARARAPLPLDDVLALGQRLAEALQAMHVKGLLHRDVKPSNIGFSAEGVPKLLDFGLARLVAGALGVSEPPLGTGVADHELDLATLTATRSAPAPSGPTAWAGTVLYMPPEALDGRAVGGVSQDLWGLVLSLYEALAGRHPLRGAEPRDLLAARLPDLRVWRPDCPPEVAAFFARALHVSPRARWPDAAALHQALAGLARTTADRGRPE